MTKRSAESKEPVQGNVTLCIRLQKYILHGQWHWEMQSTALYCSDVMDFPEDFEGTKGLIHPDDLFRLNGALQLLHDGGLTNLDFRLITTYGEVKAITGKNVSLDPPGKEDETETPPPAWEETLQNLSLQKEADFLRQRRSIADTTEKFYQLGSFAINKSTGDAWYSDGMYRLYGLPPQSLNAHANTFHAFLYADDRLPFLDAFEAAYAAEVPVHLEYRIQVAGGEPRTVQLISYWNYNSKGQPIFTGILRDISEDAAKEGQVQEAQAKAQLQLQVLKFSEQSWNTGYWYLDLVTRKVTYSDNYYRIYGLKAQAMPSSNAFLNLVHPDDRQRVRELVDAMYSEHQLPEAEFRIVRPDGRQRVLRQSGKLLTTHTSLVMVGMVQDITVQRGLEKKVADLNEKLALQEAVRQVTEGLTDTAFITWHVAGHVSWSEGFFRLLGYKPASVEPSQRLLHRQIHPDDLKAFKDAEALATNGQHQESLHFRIVNRVGERQLSISFHRLGSGEQEVVVGVVKDLTREEAIHQKLADTTRYAETLSQSSSDILLLTDTENTVLSWNRAAEETTGIKASDAIFSNLFDLFPHLLDEVYMSRLQTARSGTDVRELRARNLYLRKAHHYHLTPLKNDKGEVTRVLHVVQDTSRELDLQQQLSERLAFIESLVDASVDRIVVLDKHMNYLYWNKKAEEYYAIAKERVIGRNILEVFPGLRNDPSYGEFRKVLKGETVYLPSSQTNEGTHYFETYLIPVKDERGDVTAILWIVHDLANELQIQQVKQKAQQQLEEEHRRLKEAQAIGKVGSFEWDAATNILHWSDEMYRIHGLEPQSEVISLERALSFIHPDEVADLKEKLIRCRKDVCTLSLTHRIVRADGEVRMVQRKLHSFADQQGKITHLSGTVHDITDEVETQQRLQKSESLLRSTEEVAHFGSYEADLQQQTFHFSNGMYRLFGEEPHSFVPSPEWIDSRTFPDDIAPVKEVLDKAIATGHPYTYQRRIYRKDGELRTLEAHGQVVCDARGRAVKLIGLVQDITERKRAEGEILNLKDEVARKATDKYLKLFNSIDEGYYLAEVILDKADKPLDILFLEENPAAVRIMGQSFVGKTLKQINPGYEAHWFDLGGHVALTGEGRRKELYSAPNGKWFNSYITKVGEGNSRQIAIVFHDFTDRKKAEEALHDLNDHLVDILESTTDAFYSVDANFHFTYVNKNAAQLWRRSPESLIGKNYWAEFPEAVGSESYQKHYEALKKGCPLHYQTVSPLLGKWIDTNIYPAKDGGLSVFFHDITERKQQEARQALLLQLTDAIRPLAGSVEIMATISETVGRYYKVGRCGYAEVPPPYDHLVVERDWTNGVMQSLQGTYPLSSFGDEIIRQYRSGQTVVVEDAFEDARNKGKEAGWKAAGNIRSSIAVQLIKGGNWVASFYVQDTVKRVWTRDEVELMEEIAERTWAAVERARAEEALRRSEERLQKALSIDTVGVLFFSLNGQITDANGALESMTGYTVKELRESLHWAMLTPPEFMEATTKAATELQTVGETAPYEKQFIRKDGSRFWGLFAPRRISGAGENSACVEFILDITKQKELEQKLKQFTASLEQQVGDRTHDLKRSTDELQKNLTILHQAEDLAQMGSWEYEIESGTFSWSEGMYKLFGLKQGTPVRPETYLDFSTGEDRTIAKRIIKNLKKDHQPFEETMQINRTGDVRLLRIKGSVVSDSEGKPQRMVGVDLDITNIKQAEEKVKETQHWLEQTALASPDAICIYHLKKKEPVYLNNCLAEWLETTSEELIRIGIDGRLKLIHPDDRLRVLHFNEKLKAAADHSILTLEYRLLGKNNTLHWVRNRSKVFLRNAKGEVTHTLSFLQDITEEKAAEQVLVNLNASLEKKNGELESKNEEITSFAFVASHDLREPLRKIHTFSDWLLTKEPALSETGRHNVEKMAGAVKRLELLINDVLSLTKVHVGNERVKAVDLNRLLQQLKDEMHEKLQQTGAVIEVDELPCIAGAENQLLYLFKNLVSNAIKFQPKDGHPVLRIQAESNTNWIKIIVSDNGLGIPEEYHKKIFEMFRRLHSREEFEGTGMGLAICRKIMEKHGGKITVESHPGKGSTFTCWFPAQLSTGTGE